MVWGGLPTLERLRALDPDVVAIVSSDYSSDPVMADHTYLGFVGQGTQTPYARGPRGRHCTILGARP